MAPRRKLTPQQTAERQRNGLSSRTVSARVSRGWAIEEAISIPFGMPIKGKNTLAATARANGVSRQAYHVRLACGWDKVTAATMPVHGDMSRVGRKKKNSIYGSLNPWRKVAIANGIPVVTFQSRLVRGIAPEIAATKPMRPYTRRKTDR